MHHLSAEMMLLLCAVFALLIGALVQRFMQYSRFPFSIALLIIGVLIGLLARSGALEQNAPLANELVHYVASIDPHVVLALFLPVLIFQSAYSMEPHLFRRLLPQISLLAIPGLVIATGITAALCRYVLPWDWGWGEALLFGALISATDPVAVVAMLKEMGARKRLETLLEGESLLNDGTAIVLFMLFLNWVGGTSGEGGIASALGDFLYVALGGGILGYLLARLLLVWINAIQRDPLSQISLSIASAFACYLAAEQVFHISGIVSVVVLAATLATHSKLLLSAEVEQFLFRFWEMMAHMANILIFLLVGITIAVQMPVGAELSWGLLPWIYLLVMLARALTLMLLYPVLKASKLGFRQDKAWVLFWGSLRGAVSLMLALTLLGSALSEQAQSELLFAAAGVVSLTLLLNGTTMQALFEWLGLSTPVERPGSPYDNARKMIDQHLHQQIPELRQAALFNRVDWAEVTGQLKLATSNGLTAAPASPRQPAARPGDKASSQQTFLRQLLEAEKQHYWQQFRMGYIGRQAMARLEPVIDHALDDEPSLLHHQQVLQHTRWSWRMRLAKRLPWLPFWIRRRLLQGAFNRLQLGYDIARGFYTAQQQLQSLLTELSPTPELQQLAQKAITENQQQVQLRMAALDRAFPELVAALETYAATRVLLLQKQHHLHQIVADGLLLEGDEQRLAQEIERQLDQLFSRPPNLAPTSLLDELKACPLFSQLPADTLKALAAVAQRDLMEEGQLVVRQGSKKGVLRILLHGEVEVFCKRNGQVGEMFSLQEGCLLAPGEALTGRAEHTVKAMSPGAVATVPAHQLAALLDKHPALKQLLEQQIQ